MIEEWVRKLGAKVESTSKIDYGTQYRLSRGEERAIVNVYQGKGGIKYVVQQKSPLADELRNLASEKRVRASSSWNVWCGTDESGKGDYFGPLSVAGVMLTAAQAAALSRFGVRDSKTLSDEQAIDLDRKIRASCEFKLLGWMPEEYNARYEEARNVNRLLGEMHAGAIEALAGKRDDLEAAVTDQFGDESYVRSALGEKGRKVDLIQRPKADETDVAVAAASVIARAAFLRGLAKLEGEFGMRFPTGAGPDVIAAARAFIGKHGRDALSRVAKVHFKTTAGL